MKYSALIVAAGQGKRMNLGYNKVFCQLKNGKTIIQHVVDRFLIDENCAQIVIVMSAKEMFQCVSSNESGKIVHVVGGKTRRDSVFNGLMAVNQEYVLIHDGARPFVSEAIIQRVYQMLKTEKAVIPVVRVKDTIKEIKGDYVVETPVRENLIQAQTPQGFETELVVDCYKKAYAQGLTFTDDAQAVELVSDVKIRVVAGEYDNLKVTTIDDLEGKM